MISPHGIDLTQLLATWYGREKDPSRPLPQELDWLPDNLRASFLAASREMWSFRGPRQFCPPKSVLQHPLKSIFMVDEDADFVWAFDVADKDTLYERASLTDDWRRTAERLPEFTLHHCMMKIADYPKLYSARAVVDVEDLAAVVGRLDEVDFAGWTLYPVENIFLGDEVLVRVVPAQERAWPPVDLPGFVHVTASARSYEALQYLDEIPARGRWFKHSPARLPQSF